MKTGLDEIEMLVQVAAAQSISRAARDAKVPTSTFSRAITRLEERLGTPLLRRMSRGELLTPAGRRLVEQSREHVHALRSLTDGFGSEDGEPHGRLRITAPMDFGRMILGGVLGELARKYPDGSVPRPPYWSGFRLAPAEIEFWQDGAYRLHDRVVFRREADQWRRTLLNP